MKILCRKITWWWDYHLFSAQSRNLANGKLITPVSLITALTFSNLRQRIAQFNGDFYHIELWISIQHMYGVFIWKKIKRYHHKSQCPIIWEFLQDVQDMWSTSGMFGPESVRLGLEAFYFCFFTPKPTLG